MPNIDTTGKGKAPKTAFLNIRINKRQKEVINQAAALRKLTLSEFVIENVYDAATRILDDRTQFALSRKNGISSVRPWMPHQKPFQR